MPLLWSCSFTGPAWCTCKGKYNSLSLTISMQPPTHPYMHTDMHTQTIPWLLQALNEYRVTTIVTTLNTLQQSFDVKQNKLYLLTINTHTYTYLPFNNNHYMLAVCITCPWGKTNSLRIIEIKRFVIEALIKYYSLCLCPSWYHACVWKRFGLLPHHQVACLCSTQDKNKSYMVKIMTRI